MEILFCANKSTRVLCWFTDFIFGIGKMVDIIILRKQIKDCCLIIRQQKNNIWVFKSANTIKKEL